MKIFLMGNALRQNSFFRIEDYVNENIGSHILVGR